MATLHKHPPPPEVFYPESDGAPVAETDTHLLAMFDLIGMLRHRYRDDNEVYVAGNNFLYYEEGNLKAAISPDVYVVFGAQKGVRRVYKLWEEAQPPTVVLELTSRGTHLEDVGRKKDLCAQLGVAEYWLFDPELDSLDPPLQGYRLTGERYGSIHPDTDGGIRSEALGLTLVLEGEHLALIDTETGSRLLRPEEAQAEVSRLKAEVERLRGGEVDDRGT